MKRKWNTRQLCLLLVGLLTMQSLSAQEDFDYVGRLYNNISSKAGDTLTILADTTFLRDQPSTSGKVVQQLPNGTQVILVNDTGNKQWMKGFKASWIKVRTLGNNGAQEGFIWRGLTAIGAFASGQTRFLYGIDKVVLPAANAEDQLPACLIRLKVVDATYKKLADVSWKLGSAESTSFSEGKLLNGNMGLEGLTNIIRIYFTGEACAVPDDYYYYGWNGAELLSLPGKTMVADAGVSYHAETLLFPNEQGGNPGHIVKIIEDEETLEEVDKNGEPKTKKTGATERYKWDGRKAVKL